MNPLSPEILCNFCDEAPAALFCHDCNMHFCTANGCDEQIHSGRRHKKEAIRGSATAAPLETEAPLCEFCELSPSELYCEDCCMYLCTANGCLASVHKNAVGHEITSLLMDDTMTEVGSESDDEQEGPSEIHSQSRVSDDGERSVLSADDTESELSRLSIRSGDDRSIKGERSSAESLPAPTRQRSGGDILVSATRERSGEKHASPANLKREATIKPPTTTTSKAAASDLPRFMSATKSTSPTKTTSRGTGLPSSVSPAAAKSTPTPTRAVSNVVKRLVAPIKGTGTKEERLQRKEAVLAARQEPAVPLPYNTFGSKFAPEDAKFPGRRKPSLSFLKQPSTPSARAPSTPSSRATSSRTPTSSSKPSETKRGGEIVITSVTTIRTTTTIRADAPKAKPPIPPSSVTRARSSSNSSVASISSVRGSDVPPSIGRQVSDKNSSPAASLPSSLFSPSSALPPPTASSIRAPVRRSSIVSSCSNSPLSSPSLHTLSNASSASSASSSSASAPPRRSSNVSIAGTDPLFEYPPGLAPLGLKYVNAPEAGILVRSVGPGEAGDKAGIQVGDIVKLLNRKAVRNMIEFQSILSDLKPGVAYKMAVVRKDKSVDLKLTL